MSRTFGGTTQDAKNTPILGAPFWKKGIAIVGRVAGHFQSRNGICISIELMETAVIGGKNVKGPKTVKTTLADDTPVETGRVAIGALKGFYMALDVAGCPIPVPIGTILGIQCTGVSETEYESDMVEFAVTGELPPPPFGRQP